MILRGSILILPLCLFLAGCSTLNVETRGYPGAPIYAPISYKTVSILRNPPDAKYQRIGEIHIQPRANSSPKEILKSFREAPAKIGADAVVLAADPARKTGGPVAGPEFWKKEAPGAGDTIVGVAIWYPKSI